MINDLNELANILITNNLTISVAESCTGGLLSSYLTSIPGSSKYFKEGVVSYSIESKNKRLLIDKELINKFGIISKEIAIEMAKSARDFLKSDIGIGITGNAGPDVNQKDTPVGLVYIALAIKKEVYSYKRLFEGSRDDIRLKTVKESLEIIKKEIVNI